MRLIVSFYLELLSIVPVALTNSDAFFWDLGLEADLGFGTNDARIRQGG